MSWEKESEDDFVRKATIVVSRVKLSELKMRLQRLQSVKKPTDEELLEWINLNHLYLVEKTMIEENAKTQLDELGKEPSSEEYLTWALENHPYFTNQNLIQTLQQLIAQLEVL